MVSWRRLRPTIISNRKDFGDCSSRDRNPGGSSPGCWLPGEGQEDLPRVHHSIGGRGHRAARGGGGPSMLTLYHFTNHLNLPFIRESGELNTGFVPLHPVEAGRMNGVWLTTDPEPSHQ